MDALDLFYWDSCLFYEHLKGESVSIDKRVAVGEILLDNKDKRNRICTSVITHAEILPKKLGPEAEGKVCGLYPLKIISPSTAQGNLDV